MTTPSSAEQPKLRLPMSEVEKDGRTLERLTFHFETEKRLAARLRSAGKEERQVLYTELYDEYSRLCPDRSILNKVKTEAEGLAYVAGEFKSLSPFLKPGITFLEIGPGAGYLTRRASEVAAKCYAVDVSTEVAKGTSLPQNVEYVISDGSSIPVPEGSVDLAYSNQLMEHLHPDDAVDQLKAIHRALKPGGRYLCITPNRLTGPHDISKFFEDKAVGFHLKEYTLNELSALMREAGFSHVRRALTDGRGNYLGIWPLVPFTAYETVVSGLGTVMPAWCKRILMRNLLTRAVLQVAVLAEK